MQIKGISVQFWILVKDYVGVGTMMVNWEMEQFVQGGRGGTPILTIQHLLAVILINGRYTPVLVDDSNFPANYSIISISTGQGHSCAIIDNNDLYCWGTNFWGN